MFKQICAKLNIEKTRTTAYNPQGNGEAERNVPSIKEKLRTLSNTNKDRDINLNLTLMSIRNLSHETTKFFPYELIYGHKPKLLTDTLHEEQHRKDPEEHTYFDELRRKLANLHKIAKKNIIESQAWYKKYYAEDTNTHEYNTGDKAIIENRKKNVLTQFLDRKFVVNKYWKMVI